MPVHRFKIGVIDAAVIADGTNPKSPEEAINNERYPNASQEELQAALKYHQETKLSTESAMNILLLIIGGKRLLVDTGMSMRSPTPNYGHLMMTLAELNIAPQKIDMVYITHFHGDHIAGLLDEEMQPSFPKAQIFAPKFEWDSWMSPEALEKAGENAKRYTSILEPLKDRFTLLSYGDEVLEGVRVVDMRGHSPGHSGLLVESNGQKLLHFGDTLHIPAQMIYPNWHIHFDAEPELAEKTRREQLAFAADNDVWALFYHLAFPGLGKIKREGNSFRWQPVD
jgi:glyoxylase-like metal-dependent hydrolase (beta-lactamase superfamily II)